MKKLIFNIISFALLSISLNANANVQLSPSKDAIDKLFPVSGMTTGYDEYYAAKKKAGDRKAVALRRSNGNVDFSLVMPTLSKSSIVDFNLNEIISPVSRSIRVSLINIELPTNLSLPKQKEKYKGLSFRLNNPDFTVFLSEKKDYTLSALHGSFDVKTVIGKVRDGQPIFNLINDFKFLGGGQLAIDVNNKSNDQNISILGFEVGGSSSITAPQYDSSQYVMYGLSLESNSDGRLNPTDIKFIKPKETFVLATDQTGAKPSFALSVLTEKIKAHADPTGDSSLYEASFNKMSLSIMPMTTNNSPVLMDIIPTPIISGDKLILNPPKAIPGITPLGMIVELVQARKFKNGKIISEFKTSLWKTSPSIWASNIDLPDFELPDDPQLELRLEVSYVATADPNVNTSSATLNLNDFTHVSKNYLVID